MKKQIIRSIISFAICLSLFLPILPKPAQAFSYGSSTYWTEEYTYFPDMEYSYSSPSSGFGYIYETAADTDKLIAICQKYDDKTVTTGVRNQIEWMNQLYGVAVRNFVGQLSLGDALLISLLNHSDINTMLLTTDYTIEDINRQIARQIASGVQGYTDADTIAKATGLKPEEVRDILKQIASGALTEKTIAMGKNTSANTNRGPWLKAQALKQEKVFQYLTAEVDRMASDPELLNILYRDLGAGEVSLLLSGNSLDRYRISLYEKHLAKVLDKAVEGDQPISLATITKSDSYQITKKTQSALTKLFSYEMATSAAELQDTLSDDLLEFLKKHKSNGIFTEREARDYLVLSGQYEAGERGIGEAAKLLSKSYQYMKQLEAAMDTVGDVLSATDKLQKIESFLDFLITDYSEHLMMLDSMVSSLSANSADAELLVAARELQQQYENKLSETVNKAATELAKKGIKSVKAAFPPLGIAEACISLAGALTGASDTVDALETGLAMQGICRQALADYEAAVVTVNEGDTSDEAVSQVLATFEVARQSLISYYKAMVTLAETDDQKKAYSAELKKLEKAEFGYVTVSPVS